MPFQFFRSRPRSVASTPRPAAISRHAPALFAALLMIPALAACDMVKVPTTAGGDASSTADDRPSPTAGQSAAADRSFEPADGTGAARSSAPSDQADANVPDAVASTAAWVFRPKFDTVYGDAIAGMCFVAKAGDDDRPVLITSLSMLGRPGGLRYDIATEELGNRVRSVTLHDPVGKTPPQAVEAVPLITMPTDHRYFGASGFAFENCGNFAAFRLPESFEGPAGALSYLRPARGARAWLIGRVAADETASLVHPVVISAVTPLSQSRRPGSNDDASFGNVQSIVVAPVAATADLQGLLGAPLVNSQGEVFGVVHQFGASRDGGSLAYCVPVERFRDSLTSALERERPGEVVAVGEYSFRLPSHFLASSAQQSDSGTMWTTSDPELGTCTIELRVVPNAENLDGSVGMRMNLLRAMFRTIAKNRSYTASANGEPLDLPGVEAIKGRYKFASNLPSAAAGRGGFPVPSIGMPGSSDRNSESGLVLIGVNEDHLVLLVFHAQGSSDHTPPGLLAERAFNSLERSVAAPPSHLEPGSIKLVVRSVQNMQRNAALNAVLGAFSEEECPHFSVDATGDDVVVLLNSSLSLDQIASRIQLGSKPVVHEVNSTIVVEASTTLSSDADAPDDSQSTKLTTALTVLESRNKLYDLTAALDRLIEAKPDADASDEFRRRVATAIADAMLRWEPPVHTFEQKNGMRAIGIWDPAVARERLAEYVAEERKDMMGMEYALLSLARVADESIVPQLALALAQDPTGHKAERACAILRRFPQAAERAVIEVFDTMEFEEGVSKMEAVELLGRIGGADSLALLKKLRRTHQTDWQLKRINPAIESISQRLSEN
ncbi:MAG: hypothetical protein KF847_01305 [Pirellulales bacterium]|nr:hypothetical protein [Pirellulales bacterium]